MIPVRLELPYGKRSRTVVEIRDLNVGNSLYCIEHWEETYVDESWKPKGNGDSNQLILLEKDLPKLISVLIQLEGI